jgi:hypothetical protein
MSEIQPLMIAVSLKSEARQVSREVQRLQNNCLSTLSVLKRYEMSDIYCKFRVRSLHAVKSYISAFLTITLRRTLCIYV